MSKTLNYGLALLALLGDGKLAKAEDYSSEYIPALETRYGTEVAPSGGLNPSTYKQFNNIVGGAYNAIITAQNWNAADSADVFNACVNNFTCAYFPEDSIAVRVNPTEGWKVERGVAPADTSSTPYANVAVDLTEHNILPTAPMNVGPDAQASDLEFRITGANPFNGSTKLSAPGAKYAIIRDINGKVVDNYTLDENGNFTLDLSGNPTGVYQATVLYDNGKTKTKKIILMK